MLKNFQVKKFRGYDCPQKFFNNEIFPDYGIVVHAYLLFVLIIDTTHTHARARAHTHIHTNTHSHTHTHTHIHTHTNTHTLNHNL